MKTNHRRGFKESRSSISVVESVRKRNRKGFKSYVKGVYSKYLGWEFTKGHRGASRAIAGAKKFIRSRTRISLKNQLIQEITKLE